jgi:beta-galactosidase
MEAGGTWVAGPFTDIRNAEAAKFQHAPYGVLEEWAGVTNVYEIPGDPRQFKSVWARGGGFEGSLWYDSFELKGAEALATYTEGPMKGLAAVVTRKIGKGRIILLGTLPEPRALGELLLRAASDAGVAAPPSASPNLLVVPREGSAGRGIVAVELEGKPASLVLDAPATDLLTGREHAPGTLELAPFAVVVLQNR